MAKEPIEYTFAEDVEEIGRKLIYDYHNHLEHVRIAYLFLNKEQRCKGSLVAAKAKKVSEEYRMLTNYDFLIIISAPIWVSLTSKQQEAILDHELEHCWTDEDDLGNRTFKILPHDVEEFSSIIRRHGLYEKTLVHFGSVVGQHLADKQDVTVSRVGDPTPVAAPENTHKKAKKNKKHKKEKTKKSKGLVITKSKNPDDAMFAYD